MVLDLSQSPLRVCFFQGQHSACSLQSSDYLSNVSVSLLNVL